MSNGPNNPYYPPPGQYPYVQGQPQQPYQQQPAAPQQQQPYQQQPLPQQQQPYYQSQPQQYPPQQNFPPQQQQQYPAGGYNLQAQYPEMAQALAEETAPKQHSSVNFSDVEYFKPRCGHSVGEQAEAVIRLLPHWSGDPSQFFWYKVSHHFCTIELEDGKKRRLPRVCPQNQVAPGASPLPCPICERRERALAAGDKEMANELSVKSRYYVNLIDMEALNSHFKQDGQTGSTVCRSKVWGMSKTLLSSVSRIIKERGLVFDMNVGRCLRVYGMKVGTEDRDVRYQLFDTGDACPVPQGFEHVQMLPLDQLYTAKSYADMAQEIRNTYADKGEPAQQQPRAQSPQVPPYQNPYQQQPVANYQQPPQAQYQPQPQQFAPQQPQQQFVPQQPQQGQYQQQQQQYPPQHNFPPQQQYQPQQQPSQQHPYPAGPPQQQQRYPGPGTPEGDIPF